MLLYKQKPKETKGDNMMLISISVVGSTGPFRFVVNKKELVAAVLQRALKSYARLGRLPVLGSDLKEFVLYCSTAAGVDALSPWETIGSRGAVNNFILCKKPPTTQPLPLAAASDKKKSLIKGWINKSFNLNIYSH
ncbi:hypothetical protein RchiOBHm_Chr2g0127581 [Rosa chinensis]|uniref:DUF7054 domain-containing protein n=1 Tax=Rosa chinensis TaxID=74649 RepID=A0A2P6RU38_ROSCH|nr:uncharacterized protein LOC112184300 [Rosa chinensis]PRQ49943.1 hypothetical protein RchiOBHm_Chr2g0127581 [Rosa chinensis]